MLKVTVREGSCFVRVSELHSYDVPCILAEPVGKLLAAYADWVEETVRR